MIFLIKRVLGLFLAFCFLFSFVVSAQNNITLKPYGEFYIYGEDNDKIAEILGLSKTELQEYCTENGIIYLALNNNNSKQIRITQSQTDFTNSIINITGLSDDKINELIPHIAGIENVRGEVIDHNGQKLVKTQLRSGDSGGDFILTEYITVADRLCYILSFYTSASTDSDYIEKTLETYECSAFMSDAENKAEGWQYIILAAAIIFGIATVAIVVWIIKDIRKDNDEEDDLEEPTDQNEDSNMLG